MRQRIAFAVEFALISNCLGAAAQGRPSAAADPRACAPGERLLPPREGSAATNGNAENLSDKLARTDGVICPPNVDPEIKVPAMDAGRTPVVPPPRSPGGNPNVRPK